MVVSAHDTRIQDDVLEGTATAHHPVRYGHHLVSLCLVLCLWPSPDILLLRGAGSGIGISVREVRPSDNIGNSAGVIVTGVVPGSPASKGEIKSGDLVTEFDGQRVTSVNQFNRVVSETPPGKKVNVILIREGRWATISVTPLLERAAR